LLAHPELSELVIAHIDCDAFYASVEKRDRPELRDRPVIVGGGVRGVVTTACYIARINGVRSAMPMFQARRLCPDAVIIPPDFKKYSGVSRQIFDKVRTLTPLVQNLSLDEAWLDLSGTERLHGQPPALTLARLQMEIERDIGVTASIGLAANRYLAKIASDLDKPRGFAVIGAAEAREFLAPRPVGLLPGVGKVLARALESRGLRTIGDIAAADPQDLARHFGSHGRRLARLALGEGGRSVDPAQSRRSISAETTFMVDLARREDLEDRVASLCDKVAHRARADGLAGSVVILKLRRSDFRTITRRKTIGAPTQTAKVLLDNARALLAPELGGNSFRLIGIGLSNLTDSESEATTLFADEEARARRSETVADSLRERFGAQALVTARHLEPRRRR
jgi:DNA polymerase-4